MGWANLKEKVRSIVQWPAEMLHTDCTLCYFYRAFVFGILFAVFMGFAVFVGFRLGLISILWIYGVKPWTS